VEKAKLAQAHFRNALHLFPPTASGWNPQVLTYSGYYDLGIKEVWDMIYSYIDFVKQNGYFNRKRNEQARYWMLETINDKLKSHFFNNPEIAEMLADKENLVLNSQQSPFTAAGEILDFYFNKRS
ncbi:MAG: methylmalonyl Co-A mutase-associated GTPase MeaB, partial [Paludibacteraceae bacterium]|nr:methylmalonyl Co-A mutase-associated GTPase MeaB [Paludibacteraceae bacterium]